MSADNWAICPQCKIWDDLDHAKQISRVEEMYGVVPPEEYIKARAEVYGPMEYEHTLREDYECWVNVAGEFLVFYKCSCDKCGFRKDFEYKEKLKLMDTDRKK